MSRSQPPTVTQSLQSGSYVIWYATGESFISAKNLRWGEKIVITERALPVKWDVFFDHDRKGYTIQIHERKSYMVTKDAKLVVTSDKELYDIIPHIKNDRVYYLIRSQTNQLLLQYNGKNKEVTAQRGTSPSFWVFEESTAATDTTSPYSVYSKNSDYFVYSATERFLDRFGLIPTYTWPKFWSEIKQINEEDQSTAIYKVIFFARHGEAFNNLHNAATLKVYEDNFDNGIQVDEYDSLKFDATLTQEGFLQVSSVQALWRRENSLEEGAIGVPEISYCSPLTRCMVTNSITFAPQLSSSPPAMNTLIVSDLREVYYNEGERPRSKAYINLVFKKFSTKGYKDQVIPASKESSASAQARARAVLDKLFMTESKDEIFVSITSHSDLMKDIITTLGADPAAFPLHMTACVFPIICQYTPSSSSNVLDDGYYNIEHYIKNSSGRLPKFADAVGLKRPVEVFDTSTRIPTTWYVKCVDKDEQLYTIRFFDEHSSEELDLYWNKSNNEVDLNTEQQAWRLVPADDGTYYIEYVGTDKTHPTQSTEYVEVKNDAKNGDPLVLATAGYEIGSPLWKFIPVTFTSGED